MTDEVEQVAAKEEPVAPEATQSPETVDTETVVPPTAIEVQKAELEERLRLLDDQARRQQSNFNRKEAQILAENEALRAKLRENLPTEDLVPDLQLELAKVKAEKARDDDIDRVGREFNIRPDWLRDQNPGSPEHLRQIASLGADQRRLAEERARLKDEMDKAIKDTREAARQEVLKVRKEIGVDTVAGTGPVSPAKSSFDNYDKMSKVEKEAFDKRVADGEFHDLFWKPKNR